MRAKRGVGRPGLGPRLAARALQRERTTTARPVAGDVDAEVARLSAALGVRLNHRPPVDDGPRERRPALDAEVLRLLPTIEAALRCYPDAARPELVRTIRLYGVYRVGGKPVLGAAASGHGLIDLALRPRTRPILLAGTLHHEIGHVVQMRDGMEKDAWEAVSGVHAYTGKGHRDAFGKRENGAMLSQGFVTCYASKNWREDFAELAELAFTMPDKARRLAAAHARLARKLTLLERQYDRVVPGIRLPWRA